MPVLASELKYYLTVSGSGKEDGSAQPDPHDSLGGFRSNVEISSGALNNLFDDISSLEASLGNTDYRCICLKNTSAETLYNTRIYVYSEVDPNSDQTISIAIERPETAGAVTGDSQNVVDEDTAPTVNTTDHNGVGSGISDFALANTSGTAISVEQGAFSAHLEPGEIVFIWIKRVIDSEAQAQSNMAFTIRVAGDTN